MTRFGSWFQEGCFWYTGQDRIRQVEVPRYRCQAWTCYVARHNWCAISTRSHFRYILNTHTYSQNYHPLAWVFASGPEVVLSE